MSYHALTCDPDCPGSDCLCDCLCHLPAASTENEHGALALDTAGKKKAPGANRGQPTTTEKESK